MFMDKLQNDPTLLTDLSSFPKIIFFSIKKKECEHELYYFINNIISALF